jgi:hypothetical protein
MRTINILLIIVILAASSCTRLSTRNKINLEELKGYTRKAITKLLEIADGQKEKVIEFVAESKEDFVNFILEQNEQLDFYIDLALSKVEEYKELKNGYVELAASFIAGFDLNALDNFIENLL